MMMTKEGSTKIVNFNTPMAEVLMLGRGHRICIIFYSINILHIDRYCVKGLWCRFPIPLLIFIYSMIGLLICKYEPFWREVSVKSLILRWPLRPVGLLYIYILVYFSETFTLFIENWIRQNNLNHSSHFL